MGDNRISFNTGQRTALHSNWSPTKRRTFYIDRDMQQLCYIRGTRMHVYTYRYMYVSLGKSLLSQISFVNSISDKFVKRFSQIPFVSASRHASRVQSTRARTWVFNLHVSCAVTAFKSCHSAFVYLFHRVVYDIVLDHNYTPCVFLLLTLDASFRRFFTRLIRCSRPIEREQTMFLCAVQRIKILRYTQSKAMNV